MGTQLFVNATVFMPDREVGVDLRVDGGRIVEAGPGLAPRGARVVDCGGRMIAPLFAGPLAVGGPATFGLLPEGELTTAVLWPEQNLTLVDAGRVVPAVTAAPGPSMSPHLGTWVDRTGHIHQELTADGRYDETRGGRRHAYRGAFRIDGDRIVYRDDLGFWAYGRFAGEVLHHGGYVFTRRR